MQNFEKKEIKAIIGLGNPGQKYYKNRHNIGFRVLDLLAQRLNSSWQQNTLMLYASVPQATSGLDHVLYLIKPQTFMNSSGQVMSFLQKKGIKPGEIIVVHDELEKPFSFVGITLSGSAKGHNGLKSIMTAIGQDFWRLKVGIGRPADKSEVPDYVLSNFSSEEEELVGQIIEKGVSSLGF